MAVRENASKRLYCGDEPSGSNVTRQPIGQQSDDPRLQRQSAALTRALGTRVLRTRKGGLHLRVLGTTRVDECDRRGYD